MAAEEPGDEGSDGEGMDDGIMMDDDEDAAAPAGAGTCCMTQWFDAITSSTLGAGR